MVVIRFFRTGKNKQPSFKIVVTDKKNAPRGGRFTEEVGFFNPLTKEKKLNAERIKYWMSVGAKPSDTVFNLLVSEKIVEGEKIPSHNVSKKKEGEAQAQAPKQAVAEAKPEAEVKAETTVEKPAV